MILADLDFDMLICIFRFVVKPIKIYVFKVSRREKKEMYEKYSISKWIKEKKEVRVGKTNRKWKCIGNFILIIMLSINRLNYILKIEIGRLTWKQTTNSGVCCLQVTHKRVWN